MLYLLLIEREKEKEKWPGGFFFLGRHAIGNAVVGFFWL
jgi:hypothetical protein